MTPKPAGSQYSRVGPWFYARFDTENGCSECLSDIWTDDRIRYVDGGIVCEDCGEEADDD